MKSFQKRIKDEISKALLGEAASKHSNMPKDATLLLHRFCTLFIFYRPPEKKEALLVSAEARAGR